MAEPQSSSPVAEQAKARSSADNAIEKTVEGERRSFETGAEGARKSAQNAGAAARDMARAGAETSRQLAESGRRAGQEVAEQWRSSIGPFAAAQMDINRWFEDLWRLTTGFSPFPTLRSAQPFGGALAAAPLFGHPATDVKEATDAYTVTVELPGLTRQDIDLSVQGDAIVICGHKAEEREDATAAYRISERRYGRFERSFPVPLDVDSGRIEAAYQDGVLKITLPKRDPEPGRQPSKIEIKG